MLNATSVQRTPLLVPSFSSKVPEVAKTLRATEEVIEASILVSAYDIYHKLIAPPFDFASLIFLDSGGYEASKDSDLSDIGEFEYEPREWSIDAHESVLANWAATVPTVMISYDHPNERLSTGDQIARARAMAPGKIGVLREILLKPEKETHRFLKVEALHDHVHDLAAFDIIGVTEKEIGHSILDRMKNIARLRMELTNAGLDKPIHVFGSLDTITTPLYFLAGADIFDGLTWLRFAYYDGYTMYKYNFGALDLGISAKSDIIDVRSWFHNYRYLAELELDMSRFLRTGDFECFGRHAELFRRAIETTQEAVNA
jgi:hypothetical protein